MQKVFDSWRGLPLDRVLFECRDLLDDESFPSVRRWRDQGGHVVGHFQVYFPEELAHAAGALPVKVCGAPIEAMQAESRFGSYLCSIIKTSLELAISGNLELDMFVTHPICDAARNLAAIFTRNTSYEGQILYLPQNPNSKHSAEYLRDEYRRLLRDMENITGRRTRPDDIRKSISVFNRNRELIRELYDIRRSTPWLLPVDEAYVLVAVGGRIPREEHNDLLAYAIDLIRQRTDIRQDRVRTVFEGGFCEQPPLDLLHLIGRACYVVDDDLLIGLRYILEDVDSDGDPIANLAAAYIEQSSYSPVQHDLRKPKENMLLDRVKGAHAEAVILAAAKMCEPGLEEQVCYSRALEDAGIPYFVGEFQETMTSLDNFEIQLETFVENIQFA